MEEKALELLLKNVNDIKDLSKNENRWILHSIYTGLAARRIAHELKLDEDLALSIGYLHDIGRIIDHNNHPIEGYFYLNNLGYYTIARYSLTHSFVNNDITLTIGTGPRDIESYSFINDYLKNNELNIYDSIIQLCDLFCLETGFTTMEKRILDVTKRKGVSDNSYQHFESVMNLKNKIEYMIGKDLYELFPEINKDDLKNVGDDRKKLFEMFKQKINRK